MSEKLSHAAGDHEFHWTPEGIRRVQDPLARPRRAAPAAGPNGSGPEASEHRRYPRIDLKLPILYKILPEEPLVASAATQPFLATKSDNVSPTGACLVLAEDLPRGTIVALSIHMTGRGKISAVGRVVWSQATENAHHYLTGLEFIVVYQKTRSHTEYLNTSVLEDFLGPS